MKKEKLSIIKINIYNLVMLFMSHILFYLSGNMMFNIYMLLKKLETLLKIEMQLIWHLSTINIPIWYKQNNLNKC